MKARVEALLTGSRLQRFAFIRHGNTLPAPGPGRDIERVLSEKGLAQCAIARERMSHLSFAPIYICSKAGRCQETARLVIGDLESSEMIQSDFLYDGTESPERARAFDELKYSPLVAYYAAGHEAVCSSFAEDALECVVSIAEQNSERLPELLSVFGHAVFSNATALAMADLLGLGDDEKEKIMGINLGETEAIIVGPEGITYLSNPPVQEEH